MMDGERREGGKQKAEGGKQKQMADSNRRRKKRKAWKARESETPPFPLPLREYISYGRRQKKL
jgi:hypothetical protein